MSQQQVPSPPRIGAPLPQAQAIEAAQTLDEMAPEARANFLRPGVLPHVVWSWPWLPKPKKKAEAPALPPPPPAPPAVSADAQGRQALRRNYLAAERYADEYLLRLGPRSVKQVLEPSDLRGTKQFLARLRAYLEAWADVVEF